MAACNEVDWNIDLSLDSDPQTEETIGFRNITITNGAIFGEVYDEPGELMSVLRGRCTPAIITGQPDMSHLQFVFSVTDNRGKVVLLILDGVGYLPPNFQLKEFRGQWRAYLPYSGTAFSFDGDPALVTGQLEELRIDEGDTGTGNGNQT